MKKYIIPFLLCALIGLILGKLFFREYKIENVNKVENNAEPVYFFQYGVYSNKKNMEKATSTLSNYIYKKDDNKYYVFIGLTNSDDNKNKLQEYFKSLGLNTYVKEIVINKKSFIDVINEYDILLKSAKTEEINKINSSMLEEYARLIKNG